MKLRYMNGEKVYADTNCRLDPKAGESIFGGNIQILKHRELVRALNSLFKDAEEYPDDVQFDLWNIVYSLNLSEARGTHHPKVETVNRRAIKFDGATCKVKSREPKLLDANTKKMKDKFKSINGGLCKQSRAEIHGGILSDTGKTFIEGLQKPSQPEKL